MNRTKWIVSLCVAAGFVLAASITIAQQSKEGKPAAAGQEAPPLPPGWTAEDMQACALAGTPGKMHEILAKDIGTWSGKNTMWMAPGMEPVASDCTATITPFMDGRFIKCEMAGDIPGMGPFNGFGICGYDNVSQKFVGTWIDNCGTGIMNGAGDLSVDGKVMTWKYTYNCPITKKPTVMRIVATTKDAYSKVEEFYGTDPKTGKEFKMMSIEYTRKQ